MLEEHFEEFFFRIAGIYRDVQKLMMRNAGDLHIKAVHCFWLYLLREHPEGLTATELAAASSATKSLVSREITQLAESGLITDAGESGKRRYGWKFTLTAEGAKVAERISALALSVQNSVNREIDPADLTVFYRVLGTLADNFSALTETNVELKETK